MNKKVAKKKPGRPRHHKSAATEQLGMIRITPEQRDNYQQAADRKEKPLATWVKSTLDKAAKRDIGT